MESSKSFLEVLDDELNVLIMHFGMCEGFDNEEVLDWAKFFLRWAESAVKHCGPWSQLSLVRARDIVRQMEIATSGRAGHLSLGNAMGEAYRNIAHELKKDLKPNLENFALGYVSAHPMVSRKDEMGFNWDEAFAKTPGKGPGKASLAR